MSPVFCRYYVFSETGESSWYPPKWIDVYDDNTGYYYYTNTKVCMPPLP
jgi:hypothetical protein